MICDDCGAPDTEVQLKYRDGGRACNDNHACVTRQQERVVRLARKSLAQSSEVPHASSKDERITPAIPQRAPEKVLGSPSGSKSEDDS